MMKDNSDIDLENERLQALLHQLTYCGDDDYHRVASVITEMFNRYRDTVDALERQIEGMDRWHSARTDPPADGEVVYVCGQHLHGLYVLLDREWYSAEEYEDDPDGCSEYAGFDLDAVDIWKEAPKAPKAPKE